MIAASGLVSACFSQTTSCEGTSVSQGDGGATDYWYDDLYPPPHTVHLNEGTEWIINVRGGGGCSDYEHLTVTDDNEPSNWVTTITMGEIYNGDFHYYPSHIPVLTGDDIEGREIYIGRTWDFDIIYNVTNDGSPMDCIDQVCTVYVVGYDPENQHDYVFVHTNTIIEDSYPLIELFSPNGNESWSGTHKVTWDAVDDQIWPPNPIDIYYSTSGTSGPWIEINSGSYSQEDDGEEDWTLPLGVESQDSYVKVVATDTKGQSSHDISDEAFEIDTIAPTVESTDPEDNEEGVPLSKEVVVMFSEPMDTESVTITQTGGTDPGGWDWTWSPCRRQCTGTHNNWDYGENIEMTVIAGFADDTEDSPNSNPTAYVWDFKVTPLEVDKVVIEDEPGGNGDAITDQTIPIELEIQGWAAGYNTTTGDYIGDVEVNWFVTNANGSSASTSPSPDVSSTFDAGPNPGDAIWKICDTEGHQYEVHFKIVEPAIDYIIIRDAPNGEGNPIDDQNINVNEDVLGYSAGYNDTHGYIEDIIAEWTVQNSNGAEADTSPSSGSSSTFDSGPKTGTAVWKACDTHGHYDTVTFTIIAMVDYIRIEYQDGTEICDVTMTTDETLRCYARAYNHGTGLLGDIAVTWSVYGDIGYVSPTYGKTTTFYAEKVGTGHIHACDGNYHTDNTGTITVTHGECCSILITPEDTSLTSDLTKQYTATCSDADGNTWEGTDGTWSETDPIGTISSSGLFDAGKVGKWTIEYTENDVSSSTEVTVTIGSITSIEITPEGWSGTADESVAYTAIGTDSDGNERDITEFTTFTTTDPLGYCDMDTYYAAKVGNWRVEGEFHGLKDSGSVSVDEGVLYEIIMEDEEGEPIDLSSAVIGQSIEIFAKGYDEDGNPIDYVHVFWDIDDKKVCELDSEEGTSTIITIKDSGSSMITAGISGITDYVTFSVPLDSDEDGMSDRWEIEHFGDLEQDEDDDPDNDGISNLDEYIDDTDPMKADSDGSDGSSGSSGLGGDKDSYDMYLLLLIIAIIAILLVVLIMLLTRKKKY